MARPLTRRVFGLGGLAILSGAASGVAMCARCEAGEPPTRIILGTATPGGGFPAYGAAFADAIHAADPSLMIETQNTKGSTENVPRLEAGTLDIALVQGEVAMLALDGIGRPRANLAVISAMYATPGMFVTRRDSSHRRIADLRGKRVVFGARGSGLGILAHYVLDGMGLDRDRDFDAVFLDRAGDGPEMVLSGKAEALWGGGTGWPGFSAVAKGPHGARFIVPDANERVAIQAKHPFLKSLPIPAGAFPGQETALTSVGSWSLVLARPSLDATLAYRLARAIYEAEQDLARRLPQAGETTAANTIAAVPAERLHPGVARFFRDIRML